MFKSKKSLNYQKAVVDRLLKQVRVILEEMQIEGKDLTKVKLRKFQKTHHIQCNCSQCIYAQEIKDPKHRGLLEDGFKVFIDSKET